MATITAYLRGGNVDIRNSEGWQISSDALSVSKEVPAGSAYGTLPTVSYGKFALVGWFDSNKNLITENTLITEENVSIFAQWRYVITPADYVDLKETLSEKNIINSVSGKEYIINNIEDSLLKTFEVNPDTVSKVLKQTTGDINIWKPVFNTNIMSVFDEAYTYDLGFLKRSAYARTEALAYEGQYEFELEEVLDKSKELNCKFTINYTKSKVNRLTEKDYSYQNRTAFFVNSVKFPILENEYDKELTLQENEYLPISKGKAHTPAGIATDWSTGLIGLPNTKKEVDVPNVSEYCTAKIIAETAESTRIRVSYRFRIWSAWSDEMVSTFVTNVNGAALYINSISISVYGTKIETNETEFNYPLIKTYPEREYELDTSELMQSKLTDDEDKLSYLTSSKIINNYNIDRKIIFFDLINPQKMQFYDSEIYVNSNNEERYIDSNDLFDIYDEHNKYMGLFRVIQSNPKWDGAFHKITSAILIDNGGVD